MMNTAFLSQSEAGLMVGRITIGIVVILMELHINPPTEGCLFLQ